jgi:hypothetical protein
MPFCWPFGGAGGGGLLQLLRAAEKGDAAAVRRLLLSEALPGAADADGLTALHKLVSGWQSSRAGEYVACAQALLVAGASPVAANKQGDTPLFMAADRGISQLQELFREALDQQRRQEEQGQEQQRRRQQRREGQAAQQQPPQQEQQPAPRQPNRQPQPQLQPERQPAGAPLPRSTHQSWENRAATKLPH